MPPYRPDFDTIPIAFVAFIHCCGVNVKALSPDSAFMGAPQIACSVLKSGVFF